MGKKGSYFNLDVTLEKARHDFAALEPAEVADKSGATFDQRNKTIKLSFLKRSFKVKHPSGEVYDPEDNFASTYPSIIILHYLVTADGTPLTGRWIAYRHLPGGDIYSDPFKKRAIDHFIRAFGEQPRQFEIAAGALGGRHLEMSGISMSIPVLPRVPLCFVLWPGDEEMSASANILFDESAASYLPTEDYAHLPAIVTGEMKKHLV